MRKDRIFCKTRIITPRCGDGTVLHAVRKVDEITVLAYN
jgi:hypothetical protein